mgnify:CR=1 FL=1|tara:strand:- start:115 stop:582 length:468 start_codon:yes stop_codon:yes gene_type:complete
MAQPPRNSEGIVLPHDDPDIAADDDLFRYIDPIYHLVDCEMTGGKRLSSAALSESNRDAPFGGMSVDIAPLMVRDEVEPEGRIPNESWGIIRLRTGDMRGHSFQVGSDPIKDDPKLDDNPQHGEVWGISKGMRKKAVKTAIMKSVRWHKKATGVR